MAEVLHKLFIYTANDPAQTIGWGQPVSMVIPTTAAAVYMYALDYPIGAPIGGVMAGLVLYISYMYNKIGSEEKPHISNQILGAMAGAAAALAGEFLAVRTGIASPWFIALSSGFAAYEGWMQTAFNNPKAESQIKNPVWWAIVIGSLGVAYALS